MNVRTPASVRIVFLSPSGELGGAETALLDMLAAIREARPDWPLAMIAASNGPLVGKASAFADAAAMPFPSALARLGEWGTARGSIGHARLRLGAALVAASAPALSYARHLRRRLHELNPDIIHSNGLKMHLLGARVRPPRAKLVWHLHDYPAARRLTARLLSSQTHRCDAMLANSESVAAEARQTFGARVPVHTVYNASTSIGSTRRVHASISTRSPACRRSVRAESVSGSSPRLLAGKDTRCFSTRSRACGTSRTCAATSWATRFIRPMRASTRSRSCARRRTRSGWEIASGFTGKVDDVSAVLRSLDIAVHASTEPEPFGLVIAEAMACGRPIVVSRAGGAAEIAQGGAVFHEPGNSAELAECVRGLAGDSARRAALGIDGRAAAVRLFSRARLRETLIPIYDALAGAALRPRCLPRLTCSRCSIWAAAGSAWPAR